MSDIQQKLQLKELEIVDENGQPRIQLLVENGMPSIRLLNTQGQVRTQIGMTEDGFPKIELSSVPDQLNVKLEIDPKGSHIKFDHQQGASCYLFLNNAGVSGLVMTDAQQQRKFAVTINEQGELKMEPGK